MSDEGEAPPEVHAFMASLATGLDTVLNGKDAVEGKSERHTGFVLMVFPFDDDSGRCNYISNSARIDIVKMMKKQVERFEQTDGRNGQSDGQ